MNYLNDFPSNIDSDDQLSYWINEYNQLSLLEFDMLSSPSENNPSEDEIQEYLNIISQKEIIYSKIPKSKSKLLGTKLYKK